MRNLFLVGLLLSQFSVVSAEEPFVFQSVRSMGMGGILSQNPAMLTEIKQKTITSSTSYQNFSMRITYPGDGHSDLYLSHIGYLISYTQPNLGISFNRWQRGDRKNEITVIDEEENEIKGKKLSYETSFLLGTGKEISSSISVGANIKYLRSDLDSEFQDICERVLGPSYSRQIKLCQAVSCDIGILFTPTSQIEIVSTFYNALSSPIDYWVYSDFGYYNVAQELPKNMTLGAKFSLNSKTLLGIQISHLLEEKVKCRTDKDFYQFNRTLNLGGEITPIPCLSLRAGLIRTKFLLIHSDYIERNIPTIGFGYRYKHIEIDFASIFDNRKKDLEEISTVSSVTSTFRYMLGASWRF